MLHAVGAQTKTQNRKMVLWHVSAPLVGYSRPRVRVADYLSAQGSGFRARQTKGSPHVPENSTTTPAANLRVNTDGLAQGL